MASRLPRALRFSKSRRKSLSSCPATPPPGIKGFKSARGKASTRVSSRLSTRSKRALVSPWMRVALRGLPWASSLSANTSGCSLAVRFRARPVAAVPSRLPRSGAKAKPAATRLGRAIVPSSWRLSRGPKRRAVASTLPLMGAVAGNNGSRATALACKRKSSSPTLKVARSTGT